MKILKEVGQQYGLLTISEVMQPDLVGLVASYVDVLQIGARNMQNFPLLIEAGRSARPVLLKRGPSATLDEFLLAAEYLLSHRSFHAPTPSLHKRTPVNRGLVSTTPSPAKTGNPGVPPAT